MRSFPVGGLAATMCATGLLLATAAQAQGRPELVDASLRNPAMKYVAAELLVQFKAGHSDVDQVGALARVGAQVASTLRRDAKGTLQKLRLPAGASVPEAIRALRGQAGIDFVEPNWIYTRQAALNPDPYYADGSLWGMYGDTSQLQTNPYGSQAAEAWAKGHTCSSKVLVGIIDEGMMKDHPDTQSNVWTNPNEIPDNGIDDDGNGYHRRHPGLGLPRQRQQAPSTAPATTTPPMSRAPSAPRATTAWAWPACAGRSRWSTSSSWAASWARVPQRTRSSRSGLPDRPEDPPWSQSGGHQQLLGRRRLLARPEGRHRPRRRGQHPVHRGSRQQQHQYRRLGSTTRKAMTAPT